MALLLGIDVSTTASKAALVDDGGTVIGVASTSHRVSSPRPGWSEQAPADWWTATASSIRRVIDEADVDGGDIAGVGLTGQMHGLVLLDADGAVLRPAILWNDGRSTAQCAWIRETIGRDRLVEITGNDAFEGFTAPKLLWVRDHEEDVYRRIRHVLLPKDYIRWKLTDDFATDRAGAGGTLLLDLASRDWSRELLDALDIDPTWLPPTHEGTTVTGTVSAGAARETGLRRGTPVVAGGGDQAAGAIGMGAVDPGMMTLTLGTSGVVFAPTAEPVVVPGGRAHSFPHAAPDRWHVMGVVLSAAGSLQWYRDTLCSDLSFDDVVGEADTVEPGCERLLFLPYLTGERTPHANARATATFFGLTTRHTRAHLSRAVLEGVAFALKDNLLLLGEAGMPEPEEIRATGGGVKSRLWRQILADVFETPIVQLETTEGASYGAALLAGVGTNVWPDAATACRAAIRTAETTEPSLHTRDAYAEAYARFRRLYPALEPHF